MAEALKQESGREQNLFAFSTGGLAEEWCQDHLEGSKMSEERANLSFFSQGDWEMGHGSPERIETIIKKVLGEKAKAEKGGHLRNEQWLGVEGTGHGLRAPKIMASVHLIFPGHSLHRRCHSGHMAPALQSSQVKKTDINQIITQINVKKKKQNSVEDNW